MERNRLCLKETMTETEIDHLRNLMVSVAQIEGFTSDRVLKYSHELDQLIVQVKLQKE